MNLCASHPIARSSITPKQPYATSTRVPVLLVPGLHDSGPGHWQTLWHERNPTFVRVRQHDVGTPDLDRWAATVAVAIDRLDAPPIIAAHSFGCLAAIRSVVHGRAIAGALLVAPADPDHFGVAPLLETRRLPFATTLVASSNDPWLKLVKAGVLATRWGSRFVPCRDAGHINADSGLGEWPFGFALLRELIDRVTTPEPPRSAARSPSAH